MLSKNEKIIFISTLMLLCVSVLMVFSTTTIVSMEKGQEPYSMLTKHIIHIAMGMFLLFLSFKLDFKILKKISIPGFFIGLLMLVVVCIPGIGHAAGGAQRWIALGPMRFQPGELVKFLVILYMSSYIGRHHKEMFSFVPGTVVPLAIVGITASLLLLQPDFGTSAIVCIVVLTQLLLYSRFSHLLVVGFFAIASAAMLVLSSPYRMRRLNSFLDPFSDPSDAGYQLIQSLIAVGSGGISGVGLGASSQKLFYLPAAHTDFIFAVIAEETGFIGSFFVLFLFILLGYAGLRVVKSLADTPFLASLALGCTALIVLPAFLNVAVVTGLLPTKGLVLPLVAYGGSAMLVNLSCIGVLLALARYARTSFEA